MDLTATFAVRRKNVADGGQVGYGGAAPPPGDRAHRSVFSVHAPDVEHLGLTPDATPTAVASNAVFHALARAVLTSTLRH